MRPTLLLLVRRKSCRSVAEGSKPFLFVRLFVVIADAARRGWRRMGVHTRDVAWEGCAQKSLTFFLFVDFFCCIDSQRLEKGFRVM